MVVKFAAAVALCAVWLFAGYAIGYEIGKNSPCSEQESFEIHPLQ